MAKIENDAYYTPIKVANDCWDLVRDTIGFNNITEIIEPSCGDGAFYHYCGGAIHPDNGYDINPKISGDGLDIEAADFLSVPMSYKPGRLFIGNPPFGTRNSLAIKFFKRCCELGDYIAFILPISQLNNNLQMYEFDLVKSVPIDEKTEYSGVKVHCCFNIYARPKSKMFNDKPDYRLKDLTIVERRRVKGDYQTGKNKEVDPNYDYAMCNWGNSSFGKVPEYVGQYAQEVYFYLHNKKYLNQLLDILSYDKIREHVKSISGKKISVAALYKYVKDNIPGIE